MGKIDTAQEKVTTSNMQILEDEDLNFILDTVCNELEVDKEIVRSGSRKQIYAEARFMSVALFREFLSYTVEEIGFVFGRDHSTIVHSSRRHDELMSIDKAYERRFDNCRGIVLVRGVTKSQHIHKYRSMSMEQIIGGLPRKVKQMSDALYRMEKRIDRIETFLEKWDMRWTTDG